MATFKTQIDNLVGKVSSPGETNPYLTAGARYLLPLIPEGRIRQVMVEAHLLTDLEEKQLIAVTRDGRRARFVPAEIAADVEDSNSIHRASPIDPAFYAKAGVLTVLPTGGTAKAYVVGFPTVTDELDTIPLFPKEFEYGVVLFAAGQYQLSVINEMFNKMRDLGMTQATPPTPPTVPDFSTDDYASIATLVSSLQVAALPTPPVYSPFAYPGVSNTAMEALPTNPSYPEFDRANLSLANFEKYLVDEEDIELAAARLREVESHLQHGLETARQNLAADVQRYGAGVQKELRQAEIKSQEEVSGLGAKIQTGLQNSLKKFEEAVTVYTATIQRDIENARLAAQKADTNARIQTEVAAQNQSRRLQKDMQAFEHELSVYRQQVAAYSAEIQARTFEFGHQVIALSNAADGHRRNFVNLNTMLQQFLGTLLRRERE